jgi:ribonuclease HII
MLSENPNSNTVKDKELIQEIYPIIEKTKKRKNISKKNKTEKPKRDMKKYRTEITNPEGIRYSGENIPWPFTTSEEELKKTLWIDEAGMGAWAGPLHVAGTYILPTFKLMGIHDSKLLKIHEREALYEKLIKSNDLLFHVESISNEELDSVGGLGGAWRLGIRRVIDNLHRQVQELFPSIVLEKTVLDGNKDVMDCKVPVVSVPKADRIFIGVGAASILAKVSRDKMMTEYADSGKYKEFETIFKNGKGYRHSKYHSDLIENGLHTDLHRKTYNPLKSYLNKKRRIVTRRILERKLQIPLVH